MRELKLLSDELRELSDGSCEGGEGGVVGGEDVGDESECVGDGGDDVMLAIEAFPKECSCEVYGEELLKLLEV